jgi:hypothetical protein
MTGRKAVMPDMDHQVDARDHHSSRERNLWSGASASAEWAVVPRKGLPGSCWNGAVAAFVGVSFHNDPGNEAWSRATVGRPMTT